MARALQQKESRDELGIGSIRDAIAETLFPGTSTLHTRARYFLFIPWAYQRAAARPSRSGLAERLREEEGDLITCLKVTADDDTKGIIGRDAGAALIRMPSTLYWQGLHVWGIRQVGGSQATIQRLLARRSGPVVRDDDGASLDATALSVWHHSLPPMPSGFPDDATFALSFDEADFLAERLRTEPSTRDSSLAELVGVAADHRAVNNIWDHPHLGSLSPRIRDVVEQGRLFSGLMHGAAWLYNVILAELRGDPPLIDQHRASFARWARDDDAAVATAANWDLAGLWAATGNVPQGASGFVSRWQAYLREFGPDSLVDNPRARNLVASRECAMKGANARTVNTKALDQWGGASATGALDFRWSTARLLLSDIRTGLELADAAN